MYRYVSTIQTNIIPDNAYQFVFGGCTNDIIAELAQLLISKGANYNILDQNSKTARQLAYETGLFNKFDFMFENRQGKVSNDFSLFLYFSHFLIFFQRS